jgi:hypothetical protein
MRARRSERRPSLQQVIADPTVIDYEAGAPIAAGAQKIAPVLGKGPRLQTGAVR